MTPVEWLTALAVIIFIDLILAGDNAVVIALAARNLPSHLQKKAVFWGTFGAIAARIIFSFRRFVAAENSGHSRRRRAFSFWDRLSADDRPL